MAQNLYIFQALNRGVPVYIVPKYDFLKMLEYIERFRITDLILVPPIAIMLAKHPAARSSKYDLSSVETIFRGAAPLGREVCEEVERIWDGKVNVKQGWGMAETTSCVLNWDPREWSNSACVGELLANCEAKIMADDEVTELDYNQRGELWVRGQNIMRGYWQKPDATKGTFSSDGWLKTGDIAYVDNQQKFFVVDRKKELIKVKGNQVAPAELEGLLLEHPSVEFSAFLIRWSCSCFLVVNLTQTQGFAYPPYNWSSQNIGFTNFALWIGSLLALATAGPLSDWISARATERNRGIREPEMRLPAMIPFVLIMILGNICVSVGFEHHWPWQAIVVIGFTCAGIQIIALPTIASTYAVDCYKPVAGSLFVAITVNKNLWSYGVSKFLTKWIVEDGYIEPIMINCGMTTLWCLFGIVFYYYGKTFRRWSKNSKVHSM